MLLQTHRPHRFLSASIPLLAACVALRASDWPGMGFVRETTYCSSSAEYSLVVVPKDRSGDIGANYRFTRSDRHVWSGDRAYTLRLVNVSDSGFITAIAYGRAGKDNPMDLDIGSEFLRVIILDAEGGEILNEVQKRCSAMNFCHSPNLPYVEQMMVDTASDRLIVRVVEWDPDSPIREDHFWWTYRLSTGEKIGRFSPRERMADANPSWWLVEAKPIDFTSLILLHWYSRSLDYEVADGGARFTLVDDTARPFWSLDAKGDYVSIGLGQYLYSTSFQSSPAILPEARPNHFAIRLFAAKERVTFCVGSTTSGRCQAMEVAREPFKDD